MLNIHLSNSDCFQYLDLLFEQGIRFDLICIDPPYDCLTGHKIETKVDIPSLFEKMRRVMKPKAFLVFSGLFPHVQAWITEASKHFYFAEHLIWAKRTTTSPYLQLPRSFENWFVYKTDTSLRYFETEGRYEDIKCPALLYGLYDVQTVKTTVSDLYRRLADQKYNDLYYSGLPTANGTINGKVNNDWHQKKLSGHLEENRNDGLYNGRYKDNTNGENIPKLLERLEPTNDAIYARSEYGRSANGNSFRYRSKAQCTLGNVWAFLPIDRTDEFEIEHIWEYLFDKGNELSLNDAVNGDEQAKQAIAQKFLEWLHHTEVSTILSYLPQNKTKMGAKGENHKHPTVKPVELIERLIRLLTADAKEGEEPAMVLDCFSGTGTTAIACYNTGRVFYGCELDKVYFDDSIKRLQEYTKNNPPKTAIPKPVLPPNSQNLPIMAEVAKENKPKQTSLF